MVSNRIDRFFYGLSLSMVLVFINTYIFSHMIEGFDTSNKKTMENSDTVKKIRDKGN